MFNNKTRPRRILAVLIGLGTLSIEAAPLPNGTVLTIEPGTTSAGGGCSGTGSCFWMEVAPGFCCWIPIQPGTDGGIVVGKNQKSGGQEGPGGSTITTPGELTAAFFFFGNYGTYATASICGATAGCTTTDATTNFFDDTPCTGSADCAARTALGSWHFAWNSVAVPFGSAGGCKSLDPTKCVGVSNWTVNTDGTYALAYRWAVPHGDLSGFGNVPLDLYLRGTIILPSHNYPPLTSNVRVTTYQDTPVDWKPVAYDPGDNLSCNIITPAVNGLVTIASDCSLGTYMPNPGFLGEDCATYRANDGEFDSNDSSVCITVNPLPSPCQLAHPLMQITLEGGGQSTTVNATLTEAFTGNIVSHTNNSVTICNGTVLNYEATSTAGNAVCTISGSPTASTGTVAAGDKLICTNKPTGQDTDRFRILAQ